MNYLRNAFGAVSQYYQDLPPINASTLTGAIDVIVVERPDSDGKLELACTPFHVRFGKWQILRPGEKQVTVMVNGKSIPFQMKIGDAGEAFFVFETDEDVPEELMTSPILGPTQIEEKEAKEHHKHAGRFGAQESSGDEEDGALSTDELEPLPSAGPSTTEDQEPEFLDLNAQRPSTSSSLTTASTRGSPSSPPTSISTLDLLKSEDSTPSPAGASPSFAHPAAQVTKKASKSMLRVGPGVASITKSAFTSGPGLIVDQAHRATEKVEHIRNLEYQSAIDSKRDEATLSNATEKDGEPPDVIYKDDVVLDMAGYHAAEQENERSGELLESLPFDRTPRRSITGPGRPIRDVRNIPMDSQSLSVSGAAPRRPSLAATSHFPSDPTTQLDHSSLLDVPSHPSSKRASRGAHRGTSAPLELDVAETQLAPEYLWEWGGFPTPSPVQRTFPLPDDSVKPSSNLRNSVSKYEDLGMDAFGLEASLSADPQDSGVVWVKAQGKEHAFQLSLCGNLLLEDDPEEDLRCFESHRIDFGRLADEPHILEDKNIAVKWDSRLITRHNSPTLMPTLQGWGKSLQDNHLPERPVSPMSDPGETTRPASPVLAPVGGHNRSVSSNWSLRWFRRGNRPLSAMDNSKRPGPVRPSLASSSTAPVESEAKANEAKATTPPTTPPAPSSPPPNNQPKKRKYAKSLRLTSDQLKSLELKKGANTITFSLSAAGLVACTAKIFVWDSSDHIVISDIDGTITKSDALGHVFTMIGRDWTHLGVAKLYTDIARNGYKLMYLTSRAIGQADMTRDYLKGIRQNNYQLPEGPVIMSPDRLIASLHREVIMRKPEVFKMACLRDIQRLFGEASRVPFYAGFGNRITDALSYRSVNVPSARIFTIDSSGEVKMELLELAGYKSSYIHMTDLVDQMFPPVHRKWATEFTDFNYWKDPIPEFELPDLSPPSPALSAVSDASGGSRLSRLRNFSLGRRSSVTSLSAAATAVGAVTGLNSGKVHHRYRSTSPLARGDYREGALSDGEVSDDETRKIAARRRLSNESSMPGSLPASEFGGYSDDEDEEEEEEEEGDDDDDDDDGHGEDVDYNELEDSLLDDLAQMEQVSF